MSRIEAAAAIVVLALLATVIALDLSGHRLLVLIGSSMEPATAKGSLIVVRAADPGALAVGDVISFDRSGHSVTHRIAAIDRADGVPVFTTKGDANETADPDRVTFAGSVGLVEAAIPFAGYVLAITQSYARFASFGLAAIFAGLALRHARQAPPIPANA
ncbi:MAG: signal peptidase I [Chloroflexi bacterium]|nr:signal peptidase I [Chloroflexota bacterium]